jgi:hypothetical protein
VSALTDLSNNNMVVGLVGVRLIILFENNFLGLATSIYFLGFG